MSKSLVSRSSIGLAAAVGLAISGLTVGGSPAAAAGELAGSWSGGGAVTLASGQKEKARCKARYTKASAKSYVMSATCATPSAKVSQTAQLRRTGANSYAGTFFNPEYGITGRIRVSVSGGRQHVYLSGDAGRAAFSLKKL